MFEVISKYTVFFSISSGPTQMSSSAYSQNNSFFLSKLISNSACTVDVQNPWMETIINLHTWTSKIVTVLCAEEFR